MKFLLISLVCIFSNVYCCTYTNTWLIVENIENSATFPYFDYQNDTFCVSTKDMNNGKAFYATTNLTNPNEQSYFEQLDYKSFDKQTSNCGSSNNNVRGCLSHCLDKQLESSVIQSVISSNDPNNIVKQVSNNYGSSSKIVVISAYLDISDSTQKISYDYFNDFNFCSVYVKVKKNSMFPYVIMTTVQKV